MFRSRNIYTTREWDRDRILNPMPGQEIEEEIYEDQLFATETYHADPDVLSRYGMIKGFCTRSYDGELCSTYGMDRSGRYYYLGKFRPFIEEEEEEDEYVNLDRVPLDQALSIMRERNGYDIRDSPEAFAFIREYWPFLDWMNHGNFPSLEEVTYGDLLDDVSNYTETIATIMGDSVYKDLSDQEKRLIDLLYAAVDSMSRNIRG